jgi:hypothetical protein
MTAVLAACLAGCASGPDVQTLATGRADVSAYTLNGSDLAQLREEAQRLCPLGGEVLRQSAQGTPWPAPADGRWRRALQTTALWLDPPQRSAQLVVVCREPGDRMHLVPAAAAAASKPAAPASTATPEWSVALPVGPVSPEW